MVFFPELTSRGTPNNDTTNAIVYPSKSSSLIEAVRGLQTGLYRVYWVKQKVDGCPRKAACLEEVWDGTVKGAARREHVR